MYITHGVPVYGMPTAFTDDFSRAVWNGLPAVTVIALLIIAGMVLVQCRTALDRHLYAIGGNVQAARQSGLAVAVLLRDGGDWRARLQAAFDPLLLWPVTSSPRGA